jgi:hypothetical protein
MICKKNTSTANAIEGSRRQFHFLLQSIKFGCIEKLSKRDFEGIAKHFDSDATGILPFTVQNAF